MCRSLLRGLRGRSTLRMPVTGRGLGANFPEEPCKSSPSRGTNTCGRTFGVTLQGQFVFEHDHQGIFTQWLAEHGSSILKVAPLTR